MRWSFLYCFLLRKIYLNYYFINKAVICNWWRKTLSHDLRGLIKIESNSPSGDIFWVFTRSTSVSITDFENGTNRTSVFSGNTFQADIVLSAIIRMSVSWEASGSSTYFSSSWAGKSSSNLCTIFIDSLKLSKNTSFQNLELSKSIS